MTQTKNEASNALEITLSSSTYTYTGSEITPDVTVTSGDKTVSGENYTVQYADNVNAGQATVTVSFTGELYQGTRSIDFTINKAANTMKASGKTVKVKYKKLKKKNQKVVRSKVMAVSGNQGAVTYVKISGHKKILIDGSTGNVTVKKKLKKKTYSVSVRVTAAGDANHYAATKVVTFKVKVK